MRKLLVLVFFIATFLSANSQNLVVEGSGSNMYVSHIVAPKENFYSIGRLYNQAPRLIASFNNIAMEKGLSIGQRVKIPLNAQNFDVTGKSNAGESLIPLTHIVAKSETLFKIGTDHSVSAQLIRQWNNLSADNISPGSPLIVGHLKVKDAETSASAIRNSAPAIAAETPVARQEVAKAPEVRQEEPVASIRSNGGTRRSVPQRATPPASEEPFSSVSQATASERTQASTATNTTPAKQSEEAISIPARETSSVRTEEEAPVKKAESKKIDLSTIDMGGSNEGAFANVFSNNSSGRSLSNKSGEAATFKSTSGWQDKKYYVLMNDVAPGTILKISAKAGKDDKFVYAKVLGSMPEMKENNGLLMRISNAAASYLGIIDPKFPVEISYYH
jgi:LysM repeat protein